MAGELPRPRFEVADIVRAHGTDLRLRRFVTHKEASVLRHLGQCRTSVLGGHRSACDRCGHEQLSYNSCRDRHCPKCQGTERAKWLERRLEHVLPIPYFHVVFTLPSRLHALVLANREPMYALLFKAASATLLQLARDEKRLGAQIGITMVLHTWGQTMLFHPHVHCVVTGGGLSRDGQSWVPAREKYLLPVKAMSRLFRGKFLAGLQDLVRADEIHFPGKLEALRDASTWAAFRDQLYGTDWVVYAKAPFGGVKQVFAYLGRYTHRVAISNHRIVDFADGKVTFAYRDYADGNKKKQTTVPAVEFLRRFLLHVLPHGFVRLRHYGLLASGNVGTKLVRAREVLERQAQPANETAPAKAPSPKPRDAKKREPWWQSLLRRTGFDVRACPHCNRGRLVRIEVIPSPFARLNLARPPPRAS